MKNMNFTSAISFLALGEPSLKSSTLAYHITVPKVVDSRMLRLVLVFVGVETGEPAPVLRCVIYNANIFTHPTDFIHPALDCGRIDLAVESLNDYRISHGLSSLGFLNPLLYFKGATGLVDIVVRVSSPVQRHRALCLRGSPCRVTGRNEPWLWYWWFHRDC